MSRCFTSSRWWCALALALGCALPPRPAAEDQLPPFPEDLFVLGQVAVLVDMAADQPPAAAREALLRYREEQLLAGLDEAARIHSASLAPILARMDRADPTALKLRASRLASRAEQLVQALARAPDAQLLSPDVAAFGAVARGVRGAVPQETLSALLPAYWRLILRVKYRRLVRTEGCAALAILRRVPGLPQGEALRALLDPDPVAGFYQLRVRQVGGRFVVTSPVVDFLAVKPDLPGSEAELSVSRDAVGVEASEALRAGGQLQLQLDRGPQQVRLQPPGEWRR